MATAAELVLGLDAGTSAVKAALVDAHGTLHAACTAAYARASCHEHGEQDPHVWWRAMAQACREVLAAVPNARERVSALGIAAQMCGCIPVDARGEPLHPCLTWLDVRSAPIARRITAGGPRIAGYGVLRLAGWLRLANGAPDLAGRDPLSKMLWFRESRPDIWQRAARVLDAKDWLVHRCTGEFTTTPDVAQLTWLLDNRVGRRSWSQSYLDRFGIPRDRLPAVVAAGSVAGVLTAGAAADLGLRAGIPVSGGAGDVIAGALGAGRFGEGAYHLSLGTSLWLGCHSRRRRVRPWSGIGTLCAAHDDRYFLVATQDRAGSAVLWAASAFGFGDEAGGLKALDAAALGTTPGTDTPLFLPWASGTSPAGASLAGTTPRSQRGDVAYAVLAGVALNARWALEQAERCVRADDAPLRLIGGGGASAAWQRVLADVLQRPLEVVARPAFGGARGAAMTAGVAAGWFDRLDDAACMARIEALIEPDRSRSRWAEDRYRMLVECRRRANRSQPARARW